MNILKTFNPLGKENDIKSMNINIVVLAILLYLFRTTLPFLKFPFLLLYVGLFIYSILRYKSLILLDFRVFLKIFLLSIILLIILVASFFLSEKYYLGVFKDIINAIILISLFYLMTLFIRSKSEFKIFYESLIRLIIIFSLLISILLLGNFLNIFSWNIPHPVNSDPAKLSIEALSTDYNFVLLPVFFGFIGVFILIIKPLSPSKRGILNLILVIYSLTVFVSGSRRGIITLIFLVLLLLVVQLFTLIKRNNRLEKIALNSRWFLFTMAFMIVIAFTFVFKSSFYFKNDALRLIGTKDVNLTKTKFAMAISRYISVIKKNISYEDIYEKIWFNGFDKSLDPDAGWGTSIHKTVYPLTGEKAEIVKPKAHGYLLDNTCNSNTIDGNAYSYTLIGNQDVNKGDSVSASVYCYVSEDFNGSNVQFFSEGSTYGNIVKDDISANNDFVKYTLTDQENNNLISNGDFKKGLLNWVAGADSTIHELIDTPLGMGIRVSRTDGNGGYWSLYYDGPRIIYYAGHTYRLKFNLKVQKGNGIPFNIGWWVNDGSQGYSGFRLPLSVKDLKNGWKEVTCSYTFESTYYGLPTFLNSLQDNSIVDIVNVELKDIDRIDSVASLVDQLGLIDINKNRGVWHKYTLKSICTGGYAPVYISFSKKGVSDFNSLKGNVIFAYPQYKIKRILNTEVPTGTSEMNQRYSPAYEIGTFSRSVQYRSGFKVPSEAGLNQVPFLFLTLLMQQDVDHDPVRNLAARLISEDTTYYGYKKNLVVKPISNKFIGDRVTRWQFAGQIFIKEYGLKEKLLGGGFSFLNWFGYYFEYDKLQSDYPHNPFLSILLYSGLIGLLIYLFFFYRVIVLYLRYANDYPVLISFFIITAFFSFFSAGSPFDPPVMGFFMLLPFFLNYVSNLKADDTLQV
jgi:hypothetical protein